MTRTFHTEPLSALDLLACTGIAAIVCFAVEIEKWLRRRRA